MSITKYYYSDRIFSKSSETTLKYLKEKLVENIDKNFPYFYILLTVADPILNIGPNYVVYTWPEYVDASNVTSLKKAVLGYKYL